jgi:sugar transferase (PEP-CTERM/EpsH1 system associated)
MRILFVTPYVPSLIRVRPYHFVGELARRHAESLLAVDSPRAFADANQLRASLASVDLVPLRFSRALRSCARDVLHGDPLQAGVCQSPELDTRLEQLLRKCDFDVVHVEHLRAAALVRRIPQHLPRVYDAVDSITLLLRRTLRSSHSLRQRVIAAVELRRTERFEGEVLKRFDRTLVTSPEDKQALNALAPTAIVTVIPNGVDLDYFRPISSPHEPATIVFSGKMSYHANASAALYFARSVLPLIRVAHPQTRFRIVGSNPPASIQRLAADPGIEVTGYVPDIREHISRATVAVCPMTVKVGIQNKLLEAMALGVPVVATGLGAEGLMATRGRDLLVADAPAEFAAHVVRLLDDRQLAEQLARAGRHYVEEHHRWDRVGAQLETLYEHALQSRHAAA